jgi:hypothetical protein
MDPGIYGRKIIASEIKHIDVTHMVLLCGDGYIADSPRCLGQRSKRLQLRRMHDKHMALVADVQTFRYPTCSPSNKERKLGGRRLCRPISRPPKRDMASCLYAGHCMS